MENEARFDFTHEILANSESIFNGEKIAKNRRISIITRIKPPPSQESLFTEFGSIDEDEYLESLEELEERPPPQLPPLIR